ncbi:MAG TPA: cytochrome c oxidase assembly protein [Streptosporangiaceae bacterium]|nr:cytochrome c oxidase assembly protein [Streptosporangiaceae bacterium]
MNVVVSYWSANVAALAAYAVAAAAHLTGMRGAATGTALPGRPRPRAQTARAVACQAGLLLALLAVVSPMGYWSYRFVWARNLQDVILAIVAPALIVLGAPWRPLRQGLVLGGRLSRPDQRTAGAAAGDQSVGDEPAGDESAGDEPAGRTWPPGWRAVPILVTVVFCAIWWLWHLPAPFDAALRSSALYAVEVVSYLTAGILLWLQLIESPPLRPQLAPLRRVVLVLAVATSGTVLGLIRVYSAGLVYPAYLGFRHHVLSVVADQQVGGAVLWVIPLVPLSVLAVALAIRWLQDEESEATAAGIDRLLRQKSAWPSGPGLR